MAERIEINGVAAGVADLRALVATNYGHFTSMQVRDGAVRGLGLHLDRLVQATEALFGSTLDRERVRGYLRHALAGDASALSLRVNVFSRAFDRERPADPVGADVLVMVGPPAASDQRALSVKSFAFTRTPAEVKHVGTFPLFHFRREAQKAGFDDALFVDAAGFVGEGSIWNVGFFDGDRVIWPVGPQLRGVSQQLLEQGLARRGVPVATRHVRLGEIDRFRAAFFTNAALPVRMISRIDAVPFAPDATLEARLADCFDSNPAEPV